MVGVAVWHPARVAVQTVMLLPALFPSAPFEPLGLFTGTPTREHLTFGYSAGTVETDVFSPAAGAGGRRHGAAIMMLGIGDLPRSDLAIHFAEALARLGVVTMLPESTGMLGEHLTFDEVDAIRASVNTMDSRADVDRARVGLIGLSASGALSIVAAGQPDLRDQIEFVNSFGSYDDASALLVDVASHSFQLDHGVVPWQPESRTVEVVANALIDAGVSDNNRMELIAGTSRDRALEIVAGFSNETRERLARVSPSSVIANTRAHIYLMHDRDDSFIPFMESRVLAASAPAGVVVRYTEFSIFAHVIPDRPVPWQTFLPDLWRLFWHVHAVLLELI